MINNIKENKFEDDEIDLIEFISILWSGKKTIIISFLLSSIFIVFYSLSLPNIYTSDAVLSPVEVESNMTDALGDMSSVAGLVGVELSSGSVDRTSIGMEVMKSRRFFENFINDNEVLVPLIATKGWDVSTNQLIIDDKIYDVKNDKWVRKVSAPLQTNKPSTQEALKAFNDIFKIDKNLKTGFINISIDHYSPYVAKRWLDAIILQINNSIREKDIIQAEAAIKQLNEEINSTRLTDLKTNLYELVEKQIEKKVIAQATPEYVFEIIDPPIAPELKSSPRRAVICILGAIAGTILGCLIVLTRFYFFSKSKISK